MKILIVLLLILFVVTTPTIRNMNVEVPIHSKPSEVTYKCDETFDETQENVEVLIELCKNKEIKTF